MAWSLQCTYPSLNWGLWFNQQKKIHNGITLPLKHQQSLVIIGRRAVFASHWQLSQRCHLPPTDYFGTAMEARMPRMARRNRG